VAVAVAAAAVAAAAVAVMVAACLTRARCLLVTSLRARIAHRPQTPMMMTGHR